MHERVDVMIDVENAEPRVFITCDIYREKYVCEDVMNILFSYGVEANCRWFHGKGFVVVDLGREVDVFRVIKFLVSRHVRGYWVIPIDIVCRSRYEDVTKCITNVIMLKGVNLPLSVVGVCRKRGNFIDSCSRLLRYVGEKIEDLGIAVVDFKGYTHVLRVEIVYETTYISLYERKDEQMFKVHR
ncbi:MAG: THUMP domain-containing protein [Ignisphaera sp.]